MDDMNLAAVAGLIVDFLGGLSTGRIDPQWWLAEVKPVVTGYHVRFTYGADRGSVIYASRLTHRELYRNLRANGDRIRGQLEAAADQADQADQRPGSTPTL